MINQAINQASKLRSIEHKFVVCLRDFQDISPTKPRNSIKHKSSYQSYFIFVTPKRTNLPIEVLSNSRMRHIKGKRIATDRIHTKSLTIIHLQLTIFSRIYRSQLHKRSKACSSVIIYSTFACYVWDSSPSLYCRINLNPYSLLCTCRIISSVISHVKVL